MIVKILSSTSSFNGVSYNTNKAQKDLGELMAVKNFGYLENATAIMPEEYKNYLKAFSATNTSVKNKQLHAVISCEGKEFDKVTLTQIAEGWLKEMGYGDNPYLIVYHGDTNNNHVHVVSTRINSEGKKIGDSYEKKRAVSALQKIMRTDVKQVANQEIDKAMRFNLSSLSQYKLILEKQGYSISEQNGKLIIRKFDDIQGVVSIDQVMSNISLFDKCEKRVSQIRSILEKYKRIHNPEIKTLYKPTTNKSLRKPIGYTSDLADFLRDKFGVDIVFHGKDGKSPYGYTVIDRAGKNVFKGGVIMPLKELVNRSQSDRNHIIATDEVVNTSYHSERVITEKKYCEGGLINTAKEKDISQNIAAEQDKHGKIYIDSSSQNFELSIADDIDDEQINGRNRRREKKSRINTR